MDEVGVGEIQDVLQHQFIAAVHEVHPPGEGWLRPVQGQKGNVGQQRRIGMMGVAVPNRSEEHTSDLQSLMRISYAVFCLEKKKKQKSNNVTYSIYLPNS